MYPVNCRAILCVLRLPPDLRYQEEADEGEIKRNDEREIERTNGDRNTVPFTQPTQRHGLRGTVVRVKYTGADIYDLLDV